MADNVALPATGEVVATDEIGGVHYQLLKLAYGALGAISLLEEKPAVDSSIQALIQKLPALGAANSLPQQNAQYMPVRHLPAKKFRTTFAKVIAAGVDSEFFTVVQIGAGQAVSQSGGNLLITAGTTANSEVVLRSTSTFNDALLLKYKAALSQRIANNNFIFELVDLIGDALAFTINSATSVTVSVPNNPLYDSANAGAYVGHGLTIGVISGAAGVPMRATISATTVNSITLTVAGWPAAGAGTCSLFGWNYHQLIYNGTNSGNMTYDAQRRGWNSGATSLTINSTAAPGHMLTLANEDGLSAVMDQTPASSTTIQATARGSRVENLPAQDVQLYLQIRSLNGTSAPASTTTLTVGFAHIENYASSNVAINQIKPQGLGYALPILITNASLPVTQSASANLRASAQLIRSNNTDISSAALTATTTSSTVAITDTQTMSFAVVVSAVSGTTPTLDVVVQESLDGGTNWRDIYHFERITQTGAYVSPALSATGMHIRYVQTVGGTTPSFTRAVYRNIGNISGTNNRNYFDRTAGVLNATAGTPTAAFNIEGCKQLTVIAQSGAATSPGSFQVEISPDGANWASLGVATATVANTGTVIFNGAVSAKFVRARVSAGGTGQTLSHINFSAS